MAGDMSLSLLDVYWTGAHFCTVKKIKLYTKTVHDIEVDRAFVE